MTNLRTAVVLFLSLCCVIDSFSKLEDITISKELTNKGSTKANKNGYPCKYASTSIKADVIAHNLVKVKLKIELQGYCQISKLEVRMFEKHSKKCLVLLVLYKRMKIFKTVETDNCRERKLIRVKSLVYGELLQFWPHSSVRVQGYIVTSHGKINMNDGDYSGSNLIDTLANKEKISTTCYDDCSHHPHKKLYKGIRSLDNTGKLCQIWKYSEKYRVRVKIKESNLCVTRPKFDSEYRPWCPDPKREWSFCDMPECRNYKRSDCVESVTISSTSSSISGSFTRKTHLRYIILLFNVKYQCIDYILPGIPKKNVKKNKNIYSFIGNCLKGTTKDRKNGKYTFKELNPNTIFNIYVIPINEKNVDMKVANYSQRTKKIKPDRVTRIDMVPKHSNIKVSWVKPKNGYVDSYRTILKQNGEKISSETTQQNSIQFDKLKQCTKYCVTVNAIYEGESSPVSDEVCAITKAKVTKPDRVTGITVKSKNSTSIKISWKYTPRTCNNNTIVLKLNGEQIHTQTTQQNSIQFDKLKQCTKYCVTVIAIYEGESSLVSDEVCAITKAKGGGDITLGKIQNGSRLSRNISWSHSTEKCVGSYKIIYWVKNNESNSRKECTTNETLFYLDKLLRNKQYEIKVQAILSRTEIGNTNVSSNVQLFYTGCAQDAKHIRLITVFCVLVAFLSYLDPFMLFCGW